MDAISPVIETRANVILKCGITVEEVNDLQIAPHPPISHTYARSGTRTVLSSITARRRARAEKDSEDIVLGITKKNRDHDHHNHNPAMNSSSDCTHHDMMRTTT